MRIARMYDERNAHRLERLACEMGSLRGSTGGQFVSVHMGKIDTCPLQHSPILEHAGAATTTSGALPFVLTKATAIHGLEGGADSALKIEQVILHMFGWRSGWHDECKLRPHLPVVKFDGRPLHYRLKLFWLEVWMLI